MQVAIKFTATGGCSAFGEFSPGDVARVSADMARHLVEEARCAKYVEAPKPAEVAPEPQTIKQRKRKGQ